MTQHLARGVTSPEERRKELRERVAAPGMMIVAGVTDSLTARLAEEAGLQAVFATGAGIANSTFAVPDLGLVGLTEIAEVAGRMVRATNVPVIADGDSGHGNHLNVVRTVQEFEWRGVSAVILEDQRTPKRCGHFLGKQIVDVAEMEQKIAVATAARFDDNLLIIARTDAIAVEGFEQALERANRYVAVGADMVFVEAPETVEQLEQIPKRVQAPCLVNVVEGGRTPVLLPSELAGLGFKIGLYANVALRVAALAVRAAFAHLAGDPQAAGAEPEMLTWEDRQTLVGLDRWLAWDSFVEDKTQRVRPAPEG